MQEGYKAIDMETPRLTDPILMAIEEMLESDGRIRVPAHSVQELYFAIPVDIQIKLTNGETIMIHKTAEGSLKRTGDQVNNHPLMMGVIKIIDK